MATINRKNSKNGKQNIFATILIIFTLVVFGAGTYSVLKKKDEAALLDQKTLCPISGPESIFIVLIDSSDGLKEVQKVSIKNHISNWSENIKKHGLFELYEIDNQKSLIEHSISVCNPGKGKDVNRIDGNPKLMEKKYNEIFKAPIDEILSKIKNDRILNESPIMENIQAIAVQNMRFGSSRKPIKIIIISDLMQNSSGYSIYKQKPNFEEFMKHKYAQIVKSDLSNIEIELFVLNNQKMPSDVNKEGVISFWKMWLEEQGAFVSEIIHVPG